MKPLDLPDADVGIARAGRVSDAFERLREPPDDVSTEDHVDVRRSIADAVRRIDLPIGRSIRQRTAHA